MTLSLRSTEFIDDAVRDATATGRLEIKDLGWALGQIAQMEAWYAELRADAALLGGRNFSVTGYSLGGHLATAFNILRREAGAESGEPSPVTATYTFNGAGTGQLLNGWTLTRLIGDFNRIRANPTGSDEWRALSAGERDNVLAAAHLRAGAILAEHDRVAALSGVARAFGAAAPLGDQLALDYQIAALLVARNTRGSTNFPVPAGANVLPTRPIEAPAGSRFGNLHEIVGLEAGGLSTSFIANSGIHHGERTELYIEGQPLFRGNFPASSLAGFNLLVSNPEQNSFADTHSLVLLVDSLALMAAIERLAPEVTIEELGRMLALATRSDRLTVPFSQGRAEGDTLETVLDALGRLFVGNGYQPLVSARSLLGNTWHEVALREPFHRALGALNAAIDANDSALEGAFRIVIPGSLGAAEIARKASAAGALGAAWRYALVNLDAFVLEPTTSLVPASYAQERYALYDPAVNRRGLTAQYLHDRAAFLAWKNLDYAANGERPLASGRGETYVFTDATLTDASGYAVALTVAGTRLEGAVDPVRVTFGGEASDILSGGNVLAGDRLYGGAGVDRLAGNGGNDYLEGGADNDVLEGGGGADWLAGGHGEDILEGGSGFDTYVVGAGAERIRDADARGRLIDSSGVEISGRYLKLGDRYVLERDHSITATRGAADTVRIDLANGASAAIEGYRAGALGVWLVDHPEAGETLPPDTFPQTAGSDSFSYGFSNHAVTVQGLAGNDLVGVAVVPPGYPLPAQAGSVVEGGAGSDALFGGEGDDRLFGGVRADLDALLDGGAPAASAEREALTGNGGEDLIAGGAGADWLAGGRGADEIYGGGGDDLIAGGGQLWAGSYWGSGGFLLDFADGLDAPDLAPGQILPLPQQTLLFGVNLSSHSGLRVLTPGALAAIEAQGRIVRAGFDDADEDDGADALFAGSGNDEVWAGFGEDHVEGDAGADTLYGEEGADTLFGGEGADRLYGDAEGAQPVRHGGDYLDGGEGEDLLIAQGGADILFGGTGNDVLHGDAEWLASGFHGDDELDGGAGDDELHGHAGSDRLHGGSGNDQAHGGAGDDFLDAGAGEDRLFGDWGRDELLGGEGADGLYGGADNDYLEGGDGEDALAGEAGHDGLAGGAGADVLEGGDGDDTLAGGPGVDRLRGGPGNDTYLLGRGDEHDTIVDNEGSNRIVFADERAGAGLRITQLPGTEDLRVFFGEGEADSVTIAGGLSYAVPEFEFANATVRSLREVLNLAQTAPITRSGPGTGATILGGSGNDRLTGGEGDVLDGGGGEDLLFAPVSNAVLAFGADDGADTVVGTPETATFVFDASVDPQSLRFTRVAPDELRAGSPRDLLLHYGAAGASIFIPDSPHVPGYGYAFASGVSFDHVGLLERSGLALEWIGAGAPESLAATRFDDRLAGAGGEDALDGRAGDDELHGGPGNDDLAGGPGEDRLAGEAGSDTLAGGAGDDRYRFVPGDGVDLLVDNEGSNTIEFGGAITLEHLGAELTNGTDGNIYLAVGYGDGDTVLVRQNFGTSASSGTVSFRLDDGTVLAGAELASLRFAAPLDFAGTDQALRLAGSRYDDTLIGSTREDRLEGGDGNDRIAGGAGNDILAGGPGDDLLVGNAGEDLLDGGAGADTYRMHRGMGRDVVLERQGATNVLELAAGLAAGELQAQRSGEDLHLQLRSSREGIIVPGYFVAGAPGAAQSWRFEFADESTATFEELLGTLEAPVRAREVQALFADFELRARAWYESALVAAGYARQADGTLAHEAVSQSPGSSARTVTSVRFSSPEEAGDAALIVRESAPLELLAQSTHLLPTRRVVQELVPGASRFVDFHAGGNRPAPGAGAPRYFELAGAQYSGLDYGTNYETIAGPDFFVDPLYGTRAPSIAGYRVFPAGSAPAYVPREIEHVHTERLLDYRVNIATVTAGESANVVYALPLTAVDGGAGEDELRVPGAATIPEPGAPSADLAGAVGVLLYGNAGDDALTGSDFDDVLIGGAGSDLVSGGAGNDTYVVFAGEGWDEIRESGSAPPGLSRENVLRLPERVAPGELSFAWTEEPRAGALAAPGERIRYEGEVLSVHAVLHVSLGGGNGVHIVIPHAEEQAAAGIDFVEFGDTARMTMAQFLALAPAQELNPHRRGNTLASAPRGFGAPAATLPLYGGAGEDLLTGASSIGGAGRDTLIGTSGPDELIGALPFANPWTGAVLGTLWDEGDLFRAGAGEDRLWTSAGSDLIEFEAGDGHDLVTDLQHDDLYYYYGGTIDGLLGTALDDAVSQPEHRAQLLSGQDTLRFGAGIAPADITVYRCGSEPAFDSLVFAHRNGADAVAFQNWFMDTALGLSALEPHEQLSRVEFHDGTVWDRARIQALASNAPRRMSVPGPGGTLQGSALNEHLVGSSGADRLAGGAGDDLLEGGGGGDTYHFGLGDGADRIAAPGAQSFDILRFGPGITPDDLLLAPGSLAIGIGDSGDSVHIEGFDPDDALNSATIEAFHFEDGTRLAYGELLGRGFEITGTAGEDTLAGTNLEDRFHGLSGADSLAGGAGDDTYFFGRGEGSDHVADRAGAHDAVVFLPGITPGEVLATREGADIALSLAGGAERIGFRQEPGSDWFIEEVRFADGTAWDARTLEALAREPPANHAPILVRSIADQHARAGAAFLFVLPAATFSDTDTGDALTLGAGLADGAALPAWLAFDAATRRFSGTPAASDTGVANIRVSATDRGGLRTADLFELSVAASGTGAPAPSEPAPAPPRSTEAPPARATAGTPASPPPSPHPGPEALEPDHFAATSPSQPGTTREHPGPSPEARAERAPSTARSAPLHPLDELFGGSAHSPFDLAARELERSARTAQPPSALEIAQRWRTVARFGAHLAIDEDEQARAGAAPFHWQPEEIILGITEFGAPATFPTLAPAGRGAANLQPLRGLSEGMQPLRA